jgi:hypothetical protein
VRVKFTHPLDSHHAVGSAEPAPDVGDFTKLPNGDDLEIGEMQNPDEDGRVMPYEEVWRELDWSIQRKDKSVSWILECLDPEDGQQANKTFYAKLGRYFLAVRRVVDGRGADYAALRMDFDEEAGEWKPRHEIGEVGNIVKTFADEIDAAKQHQWCVGEEVVVFDERCIIKAISMD